MRVADKLAEYILSLAEATRHGGDFLLGVSTRGAQALFRATQALALCEGRGYAIPDDVQRLATAVLSHRVVLKRGAGDLDATRKAIERVVASTPVPFPTVNDSGISQAMTFHTAREFARPFLSQASWPSP